MSDLKRKYLIRLHHKMQKLVNEMPDENQDKPRCQGDVNIVAQLIDDVDEIERLRAALEQYADPSFYHAVSFLVDSPAGGFADDFSDDHDDPFYDRQMPGKIAREALG